jgi:hypothetical protein
MSANSTRLCPLDNRGAARPEILCVELIIGRRRTQTEKEGVMECNALTPSSDNRLEEKQLLTNG